MPSPVPEKPGLLMRDPYQYTDSMLILPPLLARMLVYFDGEHDEGDLRKGLTQATGELEVGEVAKQMIGTLDENGFLETPTYQAMRERKHREFAEAPERTPAHVGASYPENPDELTGVLDGYRASWTQASAADGNLLGIAAPHVSPEGGYRSYAAAYQALQAEHASKTFVILGTSHYGAPEKFGLTRKPYQTPLGPVETDQAIVDRLAAAAPDSVEMEDYCHASEHSIEFQSVFLQHGLRTSLPEGERLRAVPILCGSFIESLYTGNPPESNENIRRFFDALKEVAAERDDLIWVLGVDMAHIGRRYGDQLDARAGEGVMEEVEQRDRERLDRVTAGDAAGFFDLIKTNRDDLRWCGYSPIYTFLETAGAMEGSALSYEQWNIDEQSVVTFTGAEFRKATRA